MPKIFEYLRIIVMFYSNEHEPIHVHGKYQGFESKAEFIIEDGKITDIVFKNVKGKVDDRLFRNWISKIYWWL